MVDEKQLRVFEKRLLELGDERNVLEQGGKSFSSVLDSEGSTVETQRSVLKNLISNAIRDEHNDESSDEPMGELPTDSTLDKFETIFTQADALDENSSEISQEFADDTTIEEVEDNIDLIEQSARDDESISDTVISDDFALPTAYQALSADASLLSYEEVFTYGDKSKPEPSADTSSQVENLLRDDASLSLDDEKSFKAGSQYKSLRNFSADDEKFFFENLDTYNIAIKKSVFTILTDEKISHFAERLVDLIYDSASPPVVHRECEKLLKVLLPSPVDTTIYTNETLRQRFYTSSEAVTKSVNIVFRRIFPFVVGVSLAAFLGFVFVVQPIYAFVHYRIGFSALKNSEYEMSEKHFVKASDIRSMERFYFSYAREYERQRHYADAKKKYLQLVFGLNDGLRTYMQKLTLGEELFTHIFVNGGFISAEDVIQYSRNGFLNLAAFTRDVEGNFDEARIYYNTWIVKNPDDSDFYRELGDTYIEWYDVMKDVALLEKARAMYDKTTILRNNDDISLIARIRYAVRVGDDAYIDSLYKGLLFAPISNTRMFLFVPYVELATYKLMQHKPAYVAEILDVIKSHEPEYINLDYLYAQYYSYIGYDDLYQQSLLHAQSKYESREVLRGRTLRYAIDTYILLGHLFLTKYDNVIRVKKTLLQAQRHYEDMHSLVASQNNSFLARVYELQAEIAIRENNIALAQEYIQKAQENNYNSVALLYQQGVVKYLSQNYYSAAQYFLRIVDEYISFEDVAPTSLTSVMSPSLFQYTADVDMNKQILTKNTNDILIATANALYLSENYASAALYFEKVLTNMKETATVLAATVFHDVADNGEEISNARRIAFLRNNFGVALYQLSGQQRNNSELLHTRAMNELTVANKIFQNTYRTNSDVSRKIIPNLPQTNIHAITRGSDMVHIYPSIILGVYGDKDTQRYYNQILLNGSEDF